MEKLITGIALLLGCLNTCLCQSLISSKLDSLQQALSLLPEDTQKVNTYFEIGLLQVSENEQKAIKTWEAGLDLSRGLKWRFGTTNLLKAIGNQYLQLGSTEIATLYLDQYLEHLTKALGPHPRDSLSLESLGKAYIEICQKLYRVAESSELQLRYNDSILKVAHVIQRENWLIKGMRNKASIYQHTGKYGEAISCEQNIVQYAKAKNLPHVEAQALLSIGIIHGIQGDAENMAHYYGQAINLAKATQDSLTLGMAYINFGNYYGQIGKLDTAEQFYERSIGLLQHRENAFVLGVAYGNLGSLFLDRQAYDKALALFQKAFAYIEEAASHKKITHGALSAKAAFSLEIAQMYQGEGDYDNATMYIQRTLQWARSANNKFYQLQALDRLYQIQEQTGDWKSAFYTFRAYDEIRDSIFSADQAQKLTRVELNYQFQQVREADSLASIRAIVAVELENEQKLTRRNYLIIILIAISAVAFIWLRYRQRIRAKEAALALQQERERQAQLKELDEAKSRFFANISHEFRTPLTLILGPTEELAPHLKQEPQHQALDSIRQNANRLLHLINQILDLSRVEADKQTLQVQQGNLVESLEKIAANFQQAAETKNLNLHFDRPSFPVYLPFDPEILEKIMTNLLSNAIKFTPSEGAITLTVQPGKNDQVQIDLRDSGIGISPEHLEHIFDRYYQAPTEGYTVSQVSTGIGLALVKELVLIHKGEIMVQSKPGEGTTFSLFLPSFPEAYSDEEFFPDSYDQVDSPIDTSIFITSEPQRQPDQKEQTEDHLPKVLLVEDHPEIRAFLRRTLSSTYRLIEAGNGKEGLEMAISEVPDLIITDVMMPLTDGFQLTRQLKLHELTNHIPIIILTGKSSRTSKLEGLRADAEVFLTKPLDITELQLHMQSLLNNRKILQQKFSRQLLLNDTYLEVPPKEEAFLTKVVEVIEEHLGEETFDVVQMAASLNLSRSQLFRKLKALTDQSPSQIIRNIRLRHAKHLIEIKAGTMAEIGYRVGFASPITFSKAFKEAFGVSPGKYAEKGVGE
ncbi:MAG: ATP-binding protein [Bacteroidota bacterium]